MEAGIDAFSRELNALAPERAMIRLEGVAKEFATRGQRVASGCASRGRVVTVRAVIAVDRRAVRCLNRRRCPLWGGAGT